MVIESLNLDWIRIRNRIGSVFSLKNAGSGSGINESGPETQIIHFLVIIINLFVRTTSL
jgi:hypothetical protein